LELSNTKFKRFFGVKKETFERMLAIISATPRNEDVAKNWSFNALRATFDTKALPENLPILKDLKNT